MKYIFQNLKLRKLYIFFLFLVVLNIFFSTGLSQAKTFSINDVEISTPFKINFDKNKIIGEGFIQAFNQLILSIVQSLSLSISHPFKLCHSVSLYCLSLSQSVSLSLPNISF